MKYAISQPKVTKNFEIRNSDLDVYTIKEITSWPANPEAIRSIKTSEHIKFSKKNTQVITEEKSFNRIIGTDFLNRYVDNIAKWDGSISMAVFKTQSEALEWKIKSLELMHNHCIKEIDKMKKRQIASYEKIQKNQKFIKEEHPEFFL
jgi:hypothetical protein